MHANTGNYKQLQEDFWNGPYHVYNHHDRCNSTFFQSCTEKNINVPLHHQMLQSPLPLATHLPSHPPQMLLSTHLLSHPLHVIINSSSQPSTSNITINLSSQQSTSPLESETLLDQVAHVVAQDCGENSEEHESQQDDPSQNITQWPAVQDSKGRRSSCSLGTSAS